ncbi:MAG: GNAT family N-acetyltransferase [Planctomycetota bacterium]|nr:MAG: GNAT family N-acetyltransferase [Planctomycetota bacterium]
MAAGVRVVAWKRERAGELEVAAVVACLRASLLHRRPPERVTAVRARAMLEDWLAVPRTGVLLARRPGKEPDGLAVIRMQPPAVRIVYLGVREPRQGIATALLDAVRAVAERRPETRELRVEIDPADPAQHGFFVERHGFEDVSEQPHGGRPAGGGTREFRLAVAATGG